jgi:hypothetical protein
MFADVVPIRPYDGFFKWLPQFHSATGSEHVKITLSIGIGFLLLMAILPSLANLTTGITIAHTGFTPNPNVTKTPAFVALIDTVPLVAAGIGLGWGMDHLGTIL